jgi:hypothetical protein
MLCIHFICTLTLSLTHTDAKSALVSALKAHTKQLKAFQVRFCVFVCVGECVSECVRMSGNLSLCMCMCALLALILTLSRSKRFKNVSVCVLVSREILSTKSAYVCEFVCVCEGVYVHIYTHPCAYVCMCYRNEAA